jgi:hypothetical protein
MAVTLMTPAVAETKKNYSFAELIDDVISQGYKTTEKFDGIYVSSYSANLHVQVPRENLDARTLKQELGTLSIVVEDLDSNADSHGDLDAKDRIKLNFNLSYCGGCTFYYDDRFPFTIYNEGKDKLKDSIPLAKRRPDKTYDPATAQRLVDQMIEAALAARRNGVQFTK